MRCGVVTDDDDGKVGLCPTFFQANDTAEQFAFNLGCARFPIQTLCSHGQSTQQVALGVPSPVWNSKRRFDAEGADDAPTGPCFENGKGTTEDAAGYSIPSQSYGDHIGRQKGGEGQRTENGTQTSKEPSGLAFCINVALYHAKEVRA